MNQQDDGVNDNRLRGAHVRSGCVPKMHSEMALWLPQPDGAQTSSAAAHVEGTEPCLVGARLRVSAVLWLARRAVAGVYPH